MEETHRTRFPVTLSHLNLDELSKELDRRTKETQMLQEEVEHAAKQALERADGFENTLAQSLLTTLCDMDDPVTQHLDDDQDDLSSEVTRGSVSIQEEEEGVNVSLQKELRAENVGEEGSKEELSQLHRQLEETSTRYEHLRFHFLQTVVRLETELQKAQVEKDVLSNLRMKDLRHHADQMDRMRGGGLLGSTSWSDCSGDHHPRPRETGREASSPPLGSTTESVEHEARGSLPGRTTQESMKQTFHRLHADLVVHEKQAGLWDRAASLGHAATKGPVRSLQEACGRCGALQAEVDGLRLQLGDRQKALELLRLQTEDNEQTTLQHGRIIDTLHQEKEHLTHQLHECQLEVQHLRVDLAERDSGLAALEQDRAELQASLDKQRRCLQQTILQKRQLTARVNAQRTQLLLLSEGHQGDVLKLRSQLKSTHAELEQAKRSLRTLEGADGHGLQVARGMQEQITADREQIDSLQGRIQQQEAAMEELHQEKQCQAQQSQRRVQMCLSLKEDKKRLTEELTALRSNDRRLQARVSSLEAALNKMSESFADCQDVIHQQEQEFIRLKLQHALDLKERQGRDLLNAAAPSSASVAAVPPSLAAIPPSSSSTRQASRNRRKPKVQKLKERLTQEQRPQVKELPGSFSEKCRPHTAGNATAACGLLRPGSTRESTQHRTTPELHLQRSSDLNHHHKAVISGTPADRRSPVHSLLTSSPDVELLLHHHHHRPQAVTAPT